MISSIKISALAGILTFLLSTALFSQMMGGGMMGGGYGYNRNGVSEESEGIKKVLSEIRKEQGLKEDQAVNPDKVSPKLLGELGDAVMDVMLPDKTTHEQMDNMMGGEGSASLDAMHQRMGYNYLAGYPLGMMGWGYGAGGQRGGYYGGMGSMMGGFGGFYGNNPYIPMMSFGSFMGMGTLMDINWMLDYRLTDYLGLPRNLFGGGRGFGASGDDFLDGCLHHQPLPHEPAVPVRDQPGRVRYWYRHQQHVAGYLQRVC